MRIAFPTDDLNGLNANLNPNFGKSAYLTIVELDDHFVRNTETIENPNKYLPSINATETVHLLLNKHIDLIIGENYDPNTSLALQDMRIHRFDVRIEMSTKVKKALAQFLDYLDNFS